MQWTVAAPAPGEKAFADAAAQAAARGCELLVLPELSDVRYRLDRVGAGGGGCQWMQRAARQHGIRIVGGAVRREGEHTYNAVVYVDRSGRRRAIYDKMHLFPGGALDETHLFTPGDNPVVCRMDSLQVGLAICFDLRFPALFQTLTQAGAKLIIVVAAWPAVRREDWQVLCRARAMENQVFLAGVNYCGEQAGTRFAGGSLVVDPAGQILDEARPDRASLLIVDLDQRQVDVTRKRFPLTPPIGATIKAND